VLVLAVMSGWLLMFLELILATSLTSFLLPVRLLPSWVLYA